MRCALLFFTFSCLVAQAAQAGSTALSMKSEPGDSIGIGQEYLYTAPDGTFIASRGAGNGVSISFNTPDFGEWWTLNFAAPHSGLLAPGVYLGATRYPFQEPEAPGLSVYGNGRGCNTLTGTFEVLEVAYGADDEILAFRARFEQHCEGLAPALRGEVRFNATVPIELTAPTQVSVIEGSTLSFQLIATPSAGGTVALAATGIPPGASFTDNGNNTATLAWTPTAGQAGVYVVGFQASGAGASESTFTRITVLPPPPPNDDFDHATPLGTVPLSTAQNTASATTGSDDPFCAGNNASVWFAFTAPASMRIEADTFGSGYDTAVAVFTGVRGSLKQLACNDNAEGTFQSRVRFDAAAGVTYYLMVSAAGSGSGGPLTLNLTEGPPPLSIDVAVFRFRFGSLSLSSGNATVSGSVSCSRPALVIVSGELTQAHGTAALTGHFSFVAFCNAPGSWSAPVFVFTSRALFQGRAAALLVAGPATITATAFAIDLDSGESMQRNLIVDVILRGR